MQKIERKNLFTKKSFIILFIVSIAVLCTIFYFFYQNVNKNLKMGNNLSNKTNQEIEEYILNISSYEAQIQVSVESNKNRTEYKIKQSYSSPNIEKQTVEEPSNIKGLQTIYDGNKLTIYNTKLNLSKVYENYPYVTNHYLWLNSFIEDYKNAKSNNKNYKLYEENNQIIMEVILENSNPYASSKKLFIDKTSRHNC
ncbi:MAG: hypothetical protein HFJ28_06200 [Clostridia bacterium]|nr:hypothetical protein [Clostridia bacterium]